MIKTFWDYAKWAINAYLALFFLPFYKPSSRKVWLFGGLGGKLYEDNPKVLYEHVIDHHPEIEVFWVAERGSEAEQRASGNILQKGSIKNYLCLFTSQACLFSDTFNHDIAPLAFSLPGVHYFYGKTFKVRLNHGNISFKRRVGKAGLAGKISDAVMKSYNLNIASTPFERRVLETYTRDDSVVLTGSARNDRVSVPQHHNSTILIAPTWRPWLRNISDFEKSDFFLTYKSFLTNQSFLRLLKSQGLKAKLYLHHMMRDHQDAFKGIESEQVKLLGFDCNVSEEIIKSAILITDYSSMCSERYLIRRPVLFYQFDRIKYVRDVGSYIHLEDDKYGDTAVTETEVIEQIELTIRSNFAISTNQLEGEKFFIHFADRNNCKRIYEQVASNLPRA